MAAKKKKVAPLSILVDGEKLPSVIRIKGDGIKFAKLTITSPGQAKLEWSISTLDCFMPFDKSEGVLDASGNAIVYLGPSRLKGDADFKVTVKNKKVNASVRFF